jgi:hypothetical protein
MRRRNVKHNNLVIRTKELIESPSFMVIGHQQVEFIVGVASERFSVHLDLLS